MSICCRYPAKFFFMFFSPVLLLTGCSPAPSLVFFGASFPDWLICTGIGAGIMILLHVLLTRKGHKFWLFPATMVYPCITALTAMLIWLLFFPN